MILCLNNGLVCLSLDLGEADLDWKECTPQNTRLLLNSVKQSCLSPGTISPDKHTAQVLHKGSHGIGVFVVAVIGRYRSSSDHSDSSRLIIDPLTPDFEIRNLAIPEVIEKASL